jgi:uncharacterized protein
MLAIGHMVAQHGRSLTAHYLEQAAHAGGVDAWYAFGDFCLQSDQPHYSPHKAAHWLGKAAQQGHVLANAAVGVLYLQGQGVAVDAVKALACFELAAQAGDARAQWNLGALYASGAPGVTRDLQQAFAWCRTSADQNFVPAQATLGVLCTLIGEFAQAATWWGKAAQAGDAEAQYNLARLYSQGQGVQASAELAFRWFYAAAQQGIVRAQARLGLLYATGEGVAQDSIAAHQWFHIAAQQGEDSAKANLERSRLLIGSAQIAEAVRRAQEWFAARQPGAPNLMDKPA